MPEPIRLARIAAAYSTTAAGVRTRPRSPAGNPFKDTVQISTEAQEKLKEFSSKQKGKSSSNGSEENFFSEKSSPKSKQVNNLEILHLSTNASKDQIRTAYRAAIKQYHPDNFAGLDPEFQELAEEKSKQINLAYKKLTSM